MPSKVMRGADDGAHNGAAFASQDPRQHRASMQDIAAAATPRRKTPASAETQCKPWPQRRDPTQKKSPAGADLPGKPHLFSYRKARAGVTAPHRERLATRGPHHSTSCRAGRCYRGCARSSRGRRPARARRAAVRRSPRRRSRPRRTGWTRRCPPHHVRR